MGWDMSSLNLNLIRTLDVLLETKNLTRASEKLGITQSAVSRHLTQLRLHFNDPLLLREGQRYILTLRANELLVALKRILADIDQLAYQNEFNYESCHRHFEIYGSDYLAEYMLPDITERVISLAPSLTLGFSLWQINDFDLLSKKNCDLVATIADDVPENIYGCSLGEDYPVCIMSSNHQLQDRKSLSLDDYLAWSHIRITTASDKDGFIDRYLTKLNLKRNIKLSVPSFTSALKIVERTNFLLVVPVHVARKFECQFNIRYRKIGFIEHTYHYWLLWHGRVDKDPAHGWFRRQVFDVMHNSIHGVIK